MTKPELNALNETMICSTPDAMDMNRQVALLLEKND